VGSTVPSLRLDTFKNAPIKIPTIQEQNIIANFLDLFKEKIDKEKDMLFAYRQQKAYLLRQMFI
jgi:type I restriction enzyme S subunit